MSYFFTLLGLLQNAVLLGMAANYELDISNLCFLKILYLYFLLSGHN